MESSFTRTTQPDKDLDEKAARKITKYRELYRDHRRQLDFLPAIASTSERIHCDLLRLLFLHAIPHRPACLFHDPGMVGMRDQRRHQPLDPACLRDGAMATLLLWWRARHAQFRVVCIP